jgi:CHAD domain-containing protein
VRRYVQPLRALQDRLGEINDAVMAFDAFRSARESDPADARIAFALGWLAARREALVAQAAPELEAFARARKFWTK